MWSGPDGPLGPAEVAAEGRFAGTLANHDRYGVAYLAWFFLTGCEDCPPIFLKSFGGKIFSELESSYIDMYQSRK